MSNRLPRDGEPEDTKEGTHLDAHLPRVPADLGGAVEVASHEAPCSGERVRVVEVEGQPPESCLERVTYHDPPLREGEKIYCLECGTRLFGWKNVPGGAQYLRVRRNPIERLVELLCDRFRYRFGREPAATAVKSYREMLLGWNPVHGDLGQLADFWEQFKKDHVLAWKRRMIFTHRDDFQALKKIASDFNNVLTREELEKQ